MNLTTVILAAGKGTRMNVPDLPKVLVPLNEKPLIEYVLDTIEKLDSSKTVVILGHKAKKVKKFLESKDYSNITTVKQKPQLGTGHAVDQTKKELIETGSDVLILCGDVPLISQETLQGFIDYHFNKHSKLSVLSANTDNPTGYGRIIRDLEGNFLRIVEEKDANTDEKLIKEINSGTYLVKSNLLYSALEKVNNKNAQGEYYLTDIVEIIYSQGHSISAYPTQNISEIQGINTTDDLDIASEYLNKMSFPFKILGVQQIAIGSEDKSKHLKLWSKLLGLKKVKEFKSIQENVNEDIFILGKDIAEIELDIMEPLDINQKPTVHTPVLNHIGLWVDNLENAYKELESKGVRFAPGGIRKGASGYDICFIHPKGNEVFPVSGEGVLIELVQAPDDLILKLK